MRNHEERVHKGTKIALDDAVRPTGHARAALWLHQPAEDGLLGKRLRISNK